MLNIVLLEPEIPANTGNIGRTCVLTGTRLVLVRPLGFDLDAHALHRAGLGYWESLDLVVYDSWAAFLAGEELEEGQGRERLHLLTKKARRRHVDATYRDGDYLVLGKESTGLPEDLLAAYADRCERIPILADAQSLSNAETWAHGKGDHGKIMRQDVCGNFVNPDDYRISALNLSNAAAVALYEALRQTGFAGME